MRSSFGTLAFDSPYLHFECKKWFSGVQKYSRKSMVEIRGIEPLTS